MERFQITREPIIAENIVKKVEKREAGAITTFIGTVREWTAGRRTVRLEYEAYEPMAVQMLSQIGDEICAKWEGAEAAITHRVGVLDIGEAAVVIAVSSPHRKAAYEANKYAIERIKQIVPIWKKEIWEDGEEWIGDQLETTPYPNGKPDLNKGESR
ncbi:molybdenum cofactor biosynthesis protein MoaE [Bacillus amyloliquefaciens]|uniref:molybdenum cofactor biosynthesis protein MoaE n=1 Tax=Bacillus amyloliquefaciens TaxID=1390 RepID=UPI000205985B|nr:molybdenum cofactor biosynthesis protein MoaE [Bacillus amyloliquefaciens]AEB24166.1 molybdopterin synthase catalytic subunit [Bacillus amyloliquefaciens TA208]AEK89171.1 molybdopterin synthase (large subunit) [Bacillus amyloliquefaciens XH7]